MGTFTLIRILEQFKETYRSIDVRSAILKRDDRWVNLLTLFHFSDEPISELDAKYETIEEKYGKIDTDDVKILLKSFDIDQWNIIYDGISKNKLAIDNIEIYFEKSINLEQVYCQFKDFSSYWSISENFNFFEGVETYVNEEFSKSIEQFNSNVRPFGFNSIYTAVKVNLDLERYESGSQVYFITILPIYAKIADLTIDREYLNGSIKSHFIFNDLQLNINIYEYRYGNWNTLKKIYLIKINKKLSIANPPGYFTFKINQFHLPELDLKDKIVLSLLSLSFPEEFLDKKELDVEYERNKKSLIENPLLQTFSRFCSLEQLEDALLYPIQYKKPQYRFERAVSWLLSLYGFQVIKLDEFEFLKDETTGIPSGSIDIIAQKISYNKKPEILLLLIGCTIEIPRDEDLERIKNLKENLLNKLFKNREINIIPTIFTAKPIDLKEKYVNLGITLFDAQNISAILDSFKAKQPLKLFD